MFIVDDARERLGRACKAYKSITAEQSPEGNQCAPCSDDQRVPSRTMNRLSVWAQEKKLQDVLIFHTCELDELDQSSLSAERPSSL